MKPNYVKNIFLRLLIFFIFLFLLRFIFIISFNGDFCNLSSSSNFCFFSKTPSSSQQHSTQITILPNFRASNEYAFYCKIFQDFIIHGFISPNSSAFCLNSSHIIALKDLGIVQSFSLSSEIVSSSHLPFSDQFFDFMFFHKFDLPSSIPLLGFVLEIERTLKPSGILVIHTQIKDFYAFHSILKLFGFCSFVKGRDIPGPNPLIPSIREIILKKPIFSIHNIDRKDSIDQCSVSGYKIQLIKDSEPLIEKEPLKPWITLKRNLKNVKYLTSVVDISFKPRYAYIDVGARSYGSSIGSWFNKRYPKQNKYFEIFVIEADKSFHGELRAKKGVMLLPYAAWVRNETLFFEINREPTKKVIEVNRGNRGMGRIQPVQSSINFEVNVDQIRGFDFAEWLKGEFEERDFVVVKMDVEGTEFQLIPRLIETGALCLIDEIFLECHYNRWQKCCPGVRSPKYDKTYDQCLNLLSSLRDRGVLVHQWW
ncbi:uncharacterized protein LOC110684615 [Chenopodium quinoa]|uniref:uncharacterized protein LOC110684615 n=1 Tax=Chenopodium quinoa TaxID=63459 RepID=UPI000B76E1BE|nr:uncharacterized protein LOC110684615 [Chenopodium quinoa]